MPAQAEVSLGLALPLDGDLHLGAGPRQFGEDSLILEHFPEQYETSAASTVQEPIAENSAWRCKAFQPRSLQ